MRATTAYTTERMRTLVSAAFCLVFAAAIGETAFAANRSATMLVDYHQQPYAAGSIKLGANWAGLFCDAKACALRPVALQVKTTNFSSELTGEMRVDQVSSDNIPLFAVEGLDLPTGPVPTFYLPGRWQSDGTQTAGIGAITRAEGPGTLGRILPIGAGRTLRWLPKFANGRLRYYLSDGERQQRLIAAEFWENYGHFLWIGDLDRDGRPDLFFKLPEMRCAYDYALFLSSGADAGDFVRLAARHSGTYLVCD